MFARTREGSRIGDHYEISGNENGTGRQNTTSTDLQALIPSFDRKFWKTTHFGHSVRTESMYQLITAAPVIPNLPSNHHPQPHLQHQYLFPGYLYLPSTPCLRFPFVPTIPPYHTMSLLKLPLLPSTISFTPNPQIHPLHHPLHPLQPPNLLLQHFKFPFPAGIHPQTLKG